MSEIITLPSRRPRLPRRLLNDGWWLEQPPARPSVIAFPKRSASRPKPKVRHLTLVRETGEPEVSGHGVGNGI
jgi:hypothetical protein